VLAEGQKQGSESGSGWLVGFDYPAKSGLHVGSPTTLRMYTSSSATATASKVRYGMMQMQVGKRGGRSDDKYDMMMTVTIHGSENGREKAKEARLLCVCPRQGKAR
jgi:hypothetical protein